MPKEDTKNVKEPKPLPPPPSEEDLDPDLVYDEFRGAEELEDSIEKVGERQNQEESE